MLINSVWLEVALVLCLFISPHMDDRNNISHNKHVRADHKCLHWSFCDYARTHTVYLTKENGNKKQTKKLSTY